MSDQNHHLDFHKTFSTTILGNTCMNWDDEKLEDLVMQYGVEQPQPTGGNNCRNFKYGMDQIGWENTLWCFVDDSGNIVKERCDITAFENGIHYNGNQSNTVDNKSCEAWPNDKETDSVRNDAYNSLPDSYDPDKVPHNFCRNFEGSGETTIWCLVNENGSLKRSPCQAII